MIKVTKACNEVALESRWHCNMPCNCPLLSVPCLMLLSTHQCLCRCSSGSEITDLRDLGTNSVKIAKYLTILSGMHLFSLLHGYQVQLPC